MFFFSSKKRDFYINHFSYKPEESLEHGITCRPLGEVCARSSCRIKKLDFMINRKRMFLMLISFNNHMMNRDLLKESLSS